MSTRETPVSNGKPIVNNHFKLWTDSIEGLPRVHNFAAHTARVWTAA